MGWGRDRVASIWAETRPAPIEAVAWLRLVVRLAARAGSAGAVAGVKAGAGATLAWTWVWEPPLSEAELAAGAGSEDWTWA